VILAEGCFVVRQFAVGCEALFADLIDPLHNLDALLPFRLKRLPLFQ
jgi:hypothetical protein